MSGTPDFSDLDDVALDAPAIEPKADSYLQASVDLARGQPQLVTCPRCRGSGRVFGGRCFRCSGSGRATAPRPVRMDDASVARRQKDAQRRAEDKVAEALELAERRERFAAEHPAAMEWVYSRVKSGNEFAQSCLTRFSNDGEFSPNQLTAVERCIVQDRERAATREGCRAHRRRRGVLKAVLKAPGVLYRGREHGPEASDDEMR